jgi:hypothetical protein
LRHSDDDAGPAPASADDLLSQLAGDEIDRILAEADVELPPASEGGDGAHPLMDAAIDQHSVNKQPAATAPSARQQSSGRASPRATGGASASSTSAAPPARGASSPPRAPVASTASARIAAPALGAQFPTVPIDDDPANIASLEPTLTATVPIEAENGLEAQLDDLLSILEGAAPSIDVSIQAAPLPDLTPEEAALLGEEPDPIRGPKFVPTAQAPAVRELQGAADEAALDLDLDASPFVPSDGAAAGKVIRSVDVDAPAGAPALDAASAASARRSPTDEPAALVVDHDDDMSDRERNALDLDADSSPRAALANLAGMDLADDEPAPLWLRPLMWLNAPLDQCPEAVRELIGKIAILTIFNAIAVMIYVVFFRRHS